MARRPMEAAGAVDAQNAPTALWKTAQSAVSHSCHRHSHREQVLPMFPVSHNGTTGSDSQLVGYAA